jgi:hypothetical protein
VDAPEDGAAQERVMIKFLVVDRYESAIDWGRRKAAFQLGLTRYGTRERDNVQVIVRVTELPREKSPDWLGVYPLIRGPGFEEALTAPGDEEAALALPDDDPTKDEKLGRARRERIARENAEAFEALVMSGGARWVE